MHEKILPSLFSGAVAGSLLLQSCATILSTPYQSVRVVGQPEGSKLYVNDKEVKTKPVAGSPGAVKVRLPRKRNAEIKVKHEGYKDYNEVLTPDRVNGVTHLNYLLLGALYGSISTNSSGTSEFNYTPFWWGCWRRSWG